FAPPLAPHYKSQMYQLMGTRYRFQTYGTFSQHSRLLYKWVTRSQRSFSKEVCEVYEAQTVQTSLNI
ncbi:Hypothetical predicted protein, partial [Pelobates cultripes]